MSATSKRASFRQQAIAFAVAAAFQSGLFAQELPTGGQVTQGQATISASPGFMQIHQSSGKAVLEWQSFSIGQGGHVNFHQQQGPTSVALNRVLGNNPSQIFGSLSANGRVFLVNPSGILFGPSASVDVGGLVASTLSITDEDFLAGRYLFSNAGGAGRVVNQGSLFSRSGYTALLAPQVANQGFIFASMGNVALAAGDRVSLDMVGDDLIRVSVDRDAFNAAVANGGSIEAHGGSVLLAAHRANDLLDSVLNNSGIIRASSMVERGGEIVLEGGSRGNASVNGGVFADSAVTIFSGGDLEVGGFVSASNAPMHIEAAGALTVSASGFASAGLLTSGPQTIHAGAVAIRAKDGASAFVGGGEQAINIVGGNLEVQTLAGGGSVTVTGTSQRVSVIDGDHIDVNAMGGGHAFVGVFGGPQVISITGRGRNAINVGSADALGASFVQGDSLSITAGEGTESGSITVQGGPETGSFANIGTNFGSGPETFDIATTGAIRVIGGTADSGFASGIFHNRQGQQTIRAQSIDVIAGASGSGNGAFINANGGADQWIDVPGGDIRVIAGQGGANNTAGMGNSRSGNQTILGNPDIFVSGGATSNASIQAGLGKTQTIEARNIVLTNGVGSAGNSAGVILAPRQRINATGDVSLTARSGTGNASGVRIGAPTAGTPTDLVLEVGGDLVLTGGTSGTNSAGLGGGATGSAFDNNIVVSALGDVIFDGAAGGGGTRVGSSALTAVPGGNISITGRTIRFIGEAPAAIRTLGDVRLHAEEIVQGANGFILANALTTQSQGATLLAGPNHVSRFSGMAGSDMRLVNASPSLTLGPVSASGELSIDQAGSLLMQATTESLVVRGGLVGIAAGGDFRLAGGHADGAHALLLSGGDVNLAVGGALRLDEGAGKFSWARIQAGSRDAHIRLDGSFFVNGVEGDTKDGKSGFFIVHKPAREGRDLLLE